MKVELVFVDHASQNKTVTRQPYHGVLVLFYFSSKMICHGNTLKKMMAVLTLVSVFVTR